MSAPGVPLPSLASPSRDDATTRVRTRERPYMSPYLAGVGIGVVLLMAFVIMGRGLGASGAFSTVVATGVSTVAPSTNHFTSRV